MISMMRVNGLYAGQKPGKDQKKGLDFVKLVLIFEGGKKHGFKCFGPMFGFEKINFGELITIDVDTPEITTFGEMASYGDCGWNCAQLKLVSDKPAPAQKPA